MTHRSRGRRLSGLVLTMLLTLGPPLASQSARALQSASAQADLPAAASEALELGRSAMADALALYEVGYPDQPLWREAIAAGREAVRLAPGRPEPLRFLAEALSRSNWTGPAWQAWLDYLATGESLDADANPLFVTVGNELAYTAYERGDERRALEIYRRVTEEVPFNLEAQVWMGRILLEGRQPEAASHYWRTVTERDPSDARAVYFLELAEDQARWGIDAANAFRAGVAAYEEGDLESALAHFARATEENPRYPDAWAWRGRLAFELEDYADAEAWYQEAALLEPGNATYDYFVAEAGRRLGDQTLERDLSAELEDSTGLGADGGGEAPADPGDD